MTIAELAPRIATGEVSPVDVVRRCLERIDSRRQLNAFISVQADRAMDDAQTAAREIASGLCRGPLHGIPISIKDLIDVADVPTTSGSAVAPLHPRVDAPVVRRLREAGAILIGKTNLHEFAFGTTSDETAFGAVHHPLDFARSPGGSSGGAAVALVEGMCLASIGTDTGGSIRIPSAICGTVGLKPTYGELPCTGIVPLSTTCDHVGPMTLSVEDARIVFDALRAPGEATKVRSDGPFTFGVPTGYLLEKLDPEIRAALTAVRAHLAAAGHTVVDVALPNARMTPDIYLHIVLPEASHYHAATLESDPSGYSPGVRLRLEMGRYLLAEDYVRAISLRARLTAVVDAALLTCDALLVPTVPVVAPVLGSTTVEVDGQQEPVRAATLRLTQMFNLTGHPAIALPAGRNTGGLPISMQLVAGRNRTDQLLAIAAAVERQITAGFGSVGGGAG